MRREDYDEFAQLLDDAYDLIGVGQGKVISAGAKAMFFQALAAYPLATVRTALSAHCMDKDRGKFTPKPADIIQKIEEAAARDSRPGPEEAWAIALQGRDEAATVVWTAEIAEALGACRPVLNTGDDVGARMAFKEAYNRLVTAARAARRPVVWSPSLGTDPHQRATALKQAVHAGLLPAPTVAALLPPPAAAPSNDTKAMEQIKTIKAMVAGMLSAAEEKRQKLADAKALADAEFKRKTNQSVEEYKADMHLIDRMEKDWIQQAGDIAE